MTEVSHATCPYCGRKQVALPAGIIEDHDDAHIRDVHCIASGRNFGLVLAELINRPPAPRRPEQS